MTFIQLLEEYSTTVKGRFGALGSIRKNPSNTEWKELLQNASHAGTKDQKGRIISIVFKFILINKDLYVWGEPEIHHTQVLFKLKKLTEVLKWEEGIIEVLYHPNDKKIVVHKVYYRGVKKDKQDRDRARYTVDQKTKGIENIKLSIVNTRNIKKFRDMQKGG